MEKEFSYLLSVVKKFVVDLWEVRKLKAFLVQNNVKCV